MDRYQAGFYCNFICSCCLPVYLFCHKRPFIKVNPSFFSLTMNSDYIRFLKQILIFSLILGVITSFFFLFLPHSYFSPALPFLFFFFISSSLVSYYFLQKSMIKRFIRFVNTFLLTTTLKLFLYVAVIVAYVLIHRHDAVPFMLSFFILYLCYTAFEVVSILRKTNRPQSDHPAE